MKGIRVLTAIMLVIVGLGCFGAAYFFTTIESSNLLAILFVIAGADIIMTGLYKPLFKGGPIAKLGYGENVADDGVI